MDNIRDYAIVLENTSLDQRSDLRTLLLGIGEEVFNKNSSIFTRSNTSHSYYQYAHNAGYWVGTDVATESVISLDEFVVRYAGLLGNTIQVQPEITDCSIHAMCKHLLNGRKFNTRITNV